MSKGLLLHYAILLFLLLLGGLLVIILPSPTIHWGVIGVIVTTYLIWAIWHHHSTSTLSRQALLEYAFILGIIALILLLL